MCVWIPLGFMRVRILNSWSFNLASIINKPISRGPAHDIKTVAYEASDVMGSGWRRLIVYLLNNHVISEAVTVRLLQVHRYIVVTRFSLPVGISRLTLDPQFVDYKPAASGRIYYIFWGLRFFCLLQSAKSSKKWSTTSCLNLLLKKTFKTQHKILGQIVVTLHPNNQHLT